MRLIRAIITQKGSPQHSMVSGPVFSVLLFAIMALWVHHAHAGIVKQPIHRERLVPANFLEWEDDSPDRFVMVDKSQQEVLVYRTDNLFAPEKAYKCSTGENDGPKSKQNDRKTPEGIYFFKKSYTGKYLSPIYGVRALPIDYPNLIDRREGRDGYGIWFHGTNKPLKPKDTNGCIVLDNKDVEELASMIKLFDTPIIITSRIDLVPRTEVEKEAKGLKEIIEAWRSAWEGKDIEGYMSFYSRTFSADGKNWGQWKDYKAGLARKYKRINVDIDGLRLLTNNGVVLATFYQTYKTRTFESRGTKRLYIAKNSNQWKIVGESFKGDDKIKAPAKKPALYSLKEVEKFISLWIDAWEKKDIEKYISCYDAGFKSRGMTLGAWKKHRNRLYEKYRSFKIDINNLKIKRTSNNGADVSFIQYYKTDRYKDVGIKKMSLIKKGKDWKITEEKWTPIRRKSRQ